MSRKYLFSCAWLMTLIATPLCAVDITFDMQRNAENKIVAIIAQCTLDKDESLYKESLSFSLNQPNIQLGEMQSSIEPTNFYDPLFKTTKTGYTNDVTLTIPVTFGEENAVIPAHTTLTMHYMTNKSPEPQEKIFELASENTAVSYAKAMADRPVDIATATDVDAHDAVTANVIPQEESLIKLLVEKVRSALHALADFSAGIKTYIEDLLSSKTSSLPLRLVLVFLLGVLMSLTPCIYPMIPITIGILQSSENNSIGRSFMLAGSYTLGISLTFALLGLAAATGGMQFGSLMGNPVMVIAIVALLAYLAFSMIGLYDIYIPGFMKSSSRIHKRGSLRSAFTFGMLSGAMASPCLSPGLALVLAMVASMANKMLGLLLLFAFGIGSSMPLLIIGTFSSALHVLPRAGMWMIEVKKIFGFLLLGMCFYYLRAIMPLHILLVLVGIFFVVIGVSYISQAASARHRGRFFRNIIGICTITLGLLIFARAYEERCSCSALTSEQEVSHFWQTDYEQALEQARTEHKKVFLDFTASWCSLCIAVDKNVLSQSTVQAGIAAHAIPVKVDCTNNSDAHCTNLKKQFGIVGFPTYLLIDPHTQQVIKKWGSELREVAHETFIADLAQAAQ